MPGDTNANPFIEQDRALARFEQSCPPHDEKRGVPISPAEALEKLEIGNERFRAIRKPCFEIGEFDPEVDPLPQRPIAVIVCCSDSRVPPELVFWQGLRRLFVVRVAGNTVDAAALASIVYAVAALHTPLVVVLGHEHCGAVSAAVNFVEKNEGYDSAITGIIEPILPAVIEAKRAKVGKDLIEAAIRENVRRTVNGLRISLSTYAKDENGNDRLWIVGARYDVNDGCADFFYRHTSNSSALGVA